MFASFGGCNRAVVAMALCVLGLSVNEAIANNEAKGALSTEHRVFLPSYNLLRQDAVRLLWQASFGPTPEAISTILEQGTEGWINQQLAMPASRSQLSRTIEIAMMAEPDASWFDKSVFNSIANGRVRHYQSSAWWEQALTAPDQLRQRVAFALSQITVVSITEPPLYKRSEALAVYNDLLLKHAFGNYRELLSAVSYSPAMGVYLSHQGNRKANPKRQTSPDENYARELMQLFSIGLYRTTLDGQPALDQDGQKVPVYTQQDVMELARVFTGWDLVGNTGFGRKNRFFGSYLQPMEFTQKLHDSGEKTLLGQIIPAGLGGEQDVEAALDIIFSQPSVAPFISRQLIQRLVSSNPSPAYIKRISSVFVDNGQGIRGDLASVVKAILMDSEARIPTENNAHGKLKEPIVAFAGLLRFLNVTPAPAWVTPQGGKMVDVYWFKPLNIGQDPLRSPSVFNFYEPDYQPSDNHFQQTGLFSPEAVVLETEPLVNFSNGVLTALNSSDMAAYDMGDAAFLKSMKKHRHRWKYNVRIDSHPLLNLLELSLELNTDGDFKQLNRVQGAGVIVREHALRKVLEVLEHTLLTQPLTEEYRQLMVGQLMQPIRKNGAKEAHRVIKTMIHWLVMSPNYWVVK